MVQIRTGTKVKIFNGKYTGEIGTIHDMTEDNAISVVRLKSGTLVKVLSSDIELLPDDMESDTITLDRDKLREAIRKVTDPSRYQDYFSDPTKATILSLSGGVIGKALETELFGESND